MCMAPRSVSEGKVHVPVGTPWEGRERVDGLSGVALPQGKCFSIGSTQVKDAGQCRLRLAMAVVAHVEAW
jgi:hypothetical protein